MARLPLLLSLALVGCTPTSPGPFTREITIAAGQTMVVADGVSVQFVGVSGDSRCPADAMCIQGGDAIVKLVVTSDGTRHDVELHTGGSRPTPVDGLTVELLELSPYPFSSRTIQPDEYRARIQVTR